MFTKSIRKNNIGHCHLTYFFRKRTSIFVSDRRKGFQSFIVNVTTITARYFN